MISQTAEYALRAMVWLGKEQGRPIGTGAVSRATQVPAGYLSKVLQRLAQAGLVVSVPGRGGGFQLTRSPEAISVLDVVNSVDPIERICTCPLGIESHGKKLCALHRHLDDSIALTEKAFRSTTIADLLDDLDGITALCAR